jgi:hypothetical protein
MTPLEVVEAWVERFNATVADGLAALYAEDAPSHQVMRDPVSGRAAIHEAGEVCALEWRHPNGLRGCGFFTVRDGLIHFQRGYWDRLSQAPRPAAGIALARRMAAAHMSMKEISR